MVLDIVAASGYGFRFEVRDRVLPYLHSRSSSHQFKPFSPGDGKLMERSGERNGPELTWVSEL